MTYPVYPHITDKRPQPAHTIEAVTVYYMSELTKYFHAEHVRLAVYSKSRKQEIALVRHCFRWLLYRNFNTMEIKRKYAWDHTTTLHSLSFFQSILPIQQPKLHKQITNIPKP